MTDWAARLAAAVDGELPEGVEVLRGSRPPLLDAAAIPALTAPWLAATMWLAAILREMVATHPWDWLALLCRLLALALSVRALLLCWRFYRRFRIWATSSGYGLALAPEGLLLRSPEGDTVLAREEVLGVRERGEWGQRSGRRWSEVYLVTSPQCGRLYVAIPPVFESTSGVLAEKLMMWMETAGRLPPAPAETEKEETLPSKLYDRVAAGERPAGVAVVPQGWSWLRSGPYATVLLGVVLLDGLARATSRGPIQVHPAAALIIAAALFAVPMAWLWLAWLHVAPRKGIALLMAPTGMLMRTRSGVLRVTWSGLERIQIATETAWSILEGRHQARALLIQRKNEPPIRYLESFMDLPAEVVVALAEAYKSSSRMREEPPPGTAENSTG